MATLFQALPERRVVRATIGRPLLSGIAGLIVGASASSVFAVLLTGLPDQVVLLSTIVISVGGGVCFAQLIAHSRREGAGWRRLTTIGLVLPLTSLIGLLLAGQLEPLGIGQPEPRPVLFFRLAFVSASGTIAFVCTFTAAWAFGVRGVWARALLVALITAVVYLAVALVVDPVPGMHVGGGNKAMPRVAALANFVAGLVGGAVAHRLLSRARAGT